MAQPNASAQWLPEACLHPVLSYLWDDSLISRFHQRRRQRTKDYDQTLIHQILRTRTISPLHVCRAWRQPSLRRYFRNTLIDIATRPLPSSASPHVARLFVLVGAHGLPNLQCTLPFLPLAHTLAVCYVGQGCPLEGIEGRLGRLRHVWFQSLAPVLSPAADALLQRQTARVEAMHVHLDDRAVAAVRRAAGSLRSLCLVRVGGGTLSELGMDAEYPRLRRLVFSVDPQAHMFSHPVGPAARPRRAFPSLEHLHFDHAALRGAPREEWHAAMFDSLILQTAGSLRFLTFPIVYNTERRISAGNCPRLVELRHVKCCWATGPLHTGGQEGASDSTRVLGNIAGIRTLTSYTHPSHIARLSDVPAEVACLDLRHLDLSGWPLTLANIAWILRTFPRLHSLRISLAAGFSSADHLAVHNHASLRQMHVDAAASALPGNDEMPGLLVLLENATRASPGCCLWLYDAAYAYVTQKCAEVHEGGLQGMRVFSLDVEVDDRAGSGASTPWPLVSSALAPSAAAAAVSAANGNSWSLVRRLLIE
ncbi:hypothetical protein GGI15_004059 [Coemansia interrupta]|uniref:Uncharacterized protein n=1 Tax=Coemansia interrupta TaxID=1126814 RepID=A0A9W8H7Y4_9FUNG|nr:hypothetical protein GGI15_004059 [Coemansia interrupta]